MFMIKCDIVNVYCSSFMLTLGILYFTLHIALLTKDNSKIIDKLKNSPPVQRESNNHCNDDCCCCHHYHQITGPTGSQGVQGIQSIKGDLWLTPVPQKV